ncbi:non-structural maintenance of chromosomes element 1 homolog [Sphaerodactylus townsendi]|uniref:Uncharacterized protein n=1 Tax=Sphaerodactylus townsendi TaxID=933632 RepID=A0ACB8FKL1_9SAUR|nr:non-structural maintenance of chromosomes element 1 homolog [Sphaerodactylus townsendi]
MSRAKASTPVAAFPLCQDVHTDAHRQFLQALMSRGAVDRVRAATLHRQCCELHRVHYAADKLDEFIGVINRQLQPLSMEIRKGKEEESGHTCYALVNMAETAVTRMASDYTETELELFKKTMHQIVLSENGFVSSTKMLNVADQLKPKKMRKGDAEQVLRRLVQEKWLSEKEGEFTLHARCILELEQYILSHYPDMVSKCHICHTLVIQKQVCPDCGIATHAHCLARYVQAQTEPCCPHCKQFWPQRVPELSQPATLPSTSTSR